MFLEKKAKGELMLSSKRPRLALDVQVEQSDDLDRRNEEMLREALKRCFGYDSFRSTQLQAMLRFVDLKEKCCADRFG